MLSKKDYLTPRLAINNCFGQEVLLASYGHDAAWDAGWGNQEVQE